MRSTLLRKATRQTVAVAFFVTHTYFLAQGLFEGRWWAVGIVSAAFGAFTFAATQEYRQVRREQQV